MTFANFSWNEAKLRKRLSITNNLLARNHLAQFSISKAISLQQMTIE